MSALLSDIVAFLDSELDLGSFSDSSLNGLQVQGQDEVHRVCSAVDCGLSVVQQACAHKAQLLLLHHGLIWSKPQAVVGPLKDLYRAALCDNLSIYAAHLPLDAHPLWGNNALLANLLGLEDPQPVAEYGGRTIGYCGENSRSLSLGEIGSKLSSLEGASREPFTIGFGPSTPKRIAVVSGAATDELLCFAKDRFDTLVTGEPRQFAYHFCKENQLNVVFGGHYATETLGVKKLGEVLAQKFSLAHQFIFEPTGI